MHAGGRIHVCENVRKIKGVLLSVHCVKKLISSQRDKSNNNLKTKCL